MPHCHSQRCASRCRPIGCDDAKNRWLGEYSSASKNFIRAAEVIMLTAITSLQVAEKAMSLGAFDRIATFDVVDLRQKVIRAVAKVARNSNRTGPQLPVIQFLDP